MLNDRSRRIADLFVEGAECFLGQDDGGGDVIVWVNKVNSFETEDARHDGAVARGRRIAELSKPENPEYLGLLSQINSWPDDRLAERRADQQINDLSLQALNDVEVEHKELIDRVRSGPSLLDDAQVPLDDPRRAALGEEQQEYFRLLRDRQTELREQAVTTAKGLKRADLVDEYVEAWRDREALEAFLEERRITELYCAMRDCQGVVLSQDGAVKHYDHSRCDHNVRLLSSRAEVRSFPEAALDQIIQLLDNLPVGSRDAGNLAAPESSSASSEQPKKEEESTPSTPEEMSLVAPST